MAPEAGGSGAADLARPRAMFFPRLGGYLLDGILYGLVMMVLFVPGLIMVFAAFDDCVSIDDTLFCPPGQPDGTLIVLGGLLMAAGFLLVAVLYLRALGRTGHRAGIPYYPGRCTISRIQFTPGRNRGASTSDRLSLDTE